MDDRSSSIANDLADEITANKITANSVVTFGCRLNIYESQVIRQNMLEAGSVNLMVFNTCAVTKEAERQAKKAISKAKRDNPDIKIIVTGCAAQYNPQEFASMPEVDKVIGNEEKLIPSSYSLDEQRVLVNDIMSVTETASHLVSHFDGRTRAFLQIQNGCNHRCTFCMIPLARGNSRSVPIGKISQHIEELLNNGYQEIVFTGVDITDYGLDLPGAPSLAQMITRVLQLNPGLKRLRLSSIDVAEIDERLFEMMAYEPRLMPHYHISLQSGDDMILKRMKRRHNRGQVIEFCHKLRSIKPQVSFGADIIAGFPTETDEMFANTKNLIEQAGLQFLHVFPYSARKDTPAARMPQVDKMLRKRRAAILRLSGQEQLAKFLTNNIGAQSCALSEGGDLGYTENFIKVKFASSALANSIHKVRLLNIIDNNQMLAEII
jgi:threonylcarbamoyladenosine tRNA methylthiotransferase MtaB